MKFFLVWKLVEGNFFAPLIRCVDSRKMLELWQEHSNLSNLHVCFWSGFLEDRNPISFEKSCRTPRSPSSSPNLSLLWYQLWQHILYTQKCCTPHLDTAHHAGIIGEHWYPLIRDAWSRVFQHFPAEKRSYKLVHNIILRYWPGLCWWNLMTVWIQLSHHCGEWPLQSDQLTHRVADQL